MKFPGSCIWGSWYWWETFSMLHEMDIRLGGLQTWSSLIRWFELEEAVLLNFVAVWLRTRWTYIQVAFWTGVTVTVSCSYSESQTRILYVPFYISSSGCEFWSIQILYVFGGQGIGGHGKDEIGCWLREGDEWYVPCPHLRNNISRKRDSTSSVKFWKFRDHDSGSQIPVKVKNHPTGKPAKIQVKTPKNRPNWRWGCSTVLGRIVFRLPPGSRSFNCSNLTPN